MYLIMSSLEWYIHRYLMHDSDNKLLNNINHVFKQVYYKIHGSHQDENHINHHKIVQNNGDVSVEDDGMFYSASHIPITTVVSFTMYYALTKLLGYTHTVKEYTIMFGCFGGVSYLYYLLWNILHPTYHKYGGYENNEFIRGNILYKFLEKYHLIHHLHKGDNKCNFNIIIPGFDHLAGTFRWSVDNNEFCGDNTDKTYKERVLCENVKLRKTIEYNESI